MIRNFMLESDRRHRRSASQNLVPIKEFRKKTDHSKAIFQDFEQTGKRIVQLKKKEALSNKQKTLLERLQKHAKDIVDKINNIMRGSQYDAKDILKAGYPMLVTGERASWMGLEEKSAEQKESVVKEDSEKITKPSKENKDSKIQKRKQVRQNERKEKSSQTDTIEHTLNHLEENLEDELNLDELELDEIDLDEDAQELEKVIDEYEPYVKITEADRMSGGFELKKKEFLNWFFRPGSFKELISDFTSTAFDWGKLFVGFMGLDLLFFMVEEFKYAVANAGTANIAEKCATEAMERYVSGSAGKKAISVAFRWPKFVIHKYLTPVLVKYGKSVLVKIGGKLAKGLSVAMMLQLIAYFFENWLQSIYNVAIEKQTSKAQLKSIKNSLNIVMRQYNAGFKYLDFNTENFKKGSLGLSEFMNFCEHEPLAYYMDKDGKPAGMIYLAIYDPARYKVGTGALKEFIGDENSFTTQQKAGENKNIISIWKVPESGDDELLLVARDAVGLMPKWMISVLQSKGSSLPDAGNVKEGKSYIHPMMALRKSMHLLEVDPTALDRKTVTELNKTSVIKAISSNCVLMVTQYFQMCMNQASSMVKKLSDSKAAQEGRDDFAVTGTWDVMQFAAAPFSESARKEIADSWAPCFKNIKSTYMS